MFGQSVFLEMRLLNIIIIIRKKYINEQIIFILIALLHGKCEHIDFEIDCEFNKYFSRLILALLVICTRRKG